MTDTTNDPNMATIQQPATRRVIFTADDDGNLIGATVLGLERGVHDMEWQPLDGMTGMSAASGLAYVQAHALISNRLSIEVAS